MGRPTQNAVVGTTCQSVMESKIRSCVLTRIILEDEAQAGSVLHTANNSRAHCLVGLNSSLYVKQLDKIRTTFNPPSVEDSILAELHPLVLEMSYPPSTLVECGCTDATALQGMELLQAVHAITHIREIRGARRPKITQMLAILDIKNPTYLHMSKLPYIVSARVQGSLMGRPTQNHETLNLKTTTDTLDGTSET